MLVYISIPALYYVYVRYYFKWLTPNVLMSLGSSSSKYCAGVVRFSFVNSKSAGEEKPKFMPISNEPRDATNAHIATTLIRPLPHDSVELVGVVNEKQSSDSLKNLSSVSLCAESVMVSYIIDN